jgi:hypothetical protein
MSQENFWENTLDGKWRCFVQKELDTMGVLKMEDIGTGECVFSKPVPVSKYFRQQDVLSWGNLCLIEAKKLDS